jgi:type I restriction enzyme S subunit
MKKAEKATPTFITQKFLYSDSISLLPPLEKRKIAEILGTMDDVFGKLERAIEATDRLKHGLLQELFTKGIGRRTSRELPEGWKNVTLGEIVEFQYGITVSVPKDTGTELLREADIEDDGSVDWAGIQHYPITANDYKDTSLKEGDVLIARFGSKAGRSCYIDRPIKAAFTSSLIRLQLTVPLCQKFIYFFTQSPMYWDQIERKIRNQLNKVVYAHPLAKLTMPNPSLREQERIVEILDSVDKKKALLKIKKSHYEAIKSNMMNDLRTGQVKVNA